MSLDRLAPDQRAVVQLVLQQGRSYEDLARLLGISDEAVRERARAGLLALAADVTAPPEAGEVADFLLGQQTVSQRESTREALAASPAANAWARAVSGELRDVAGDDLPEIPASIVEPAAVEPEPAPGEQPEPEPLREPDSPDDTDDDDLEPDTTTTRATTAVAKPRPRPRPLREGGAAPRPTTDKPRATAPSGDRPASKLGGALLIGGLGILVAAILLLVLTGGDDEKSNDVARGTATPAAQGSPGASGTPQALGQIQLRAAGGTRAAGVLTLFVRQEGGVVFTLQAEQVPALKDGQAYAVWMTRERGNPRRLGYFNEAPAGENRQLATSGPREQDAGKFAQWLTEYDHIVVSRETVEQARRPGPVILRGALPGSEN